MKTQFFRLTAGAFCLSLMAIAACNTNTNNTNDTDSLMDDTSMMDTAMTDTAGIMTDTANTMVPPAQQPR